MTARELVVRIEKAEAGLGTRTNGTLVVRACDESEDAALARAQAQGQDLSGQIVIVKRFCQTIAEDRRRRGIEATGDPSQTATRH